jgi:hypothetical protein
MRLAPESTRRRDERGFVLVGVVMFVLALTILGLTLFDLSGYEARFFDRALDEAQAYQSAMGGLERAKHVLTARTNSRLEDVQSLLPMEGVDSAFAGQFQSPPGDTVWSGPVDWDGEPIRIRVVARQNQVTRTVEGLFAPEPNPSLYKRLLSSAGAIFVDSTEAGGTYRRWTVALEGAVRQVGGDFTWLGYLAPPLPTDVGNDDIPLPSVPEFIATRIGTAHSLVPYYDPGSHTYTLENPDPGNVKYFYWPDSGGGPGGVPPYGYTRYHQGPATIVVRGRVVLLAERGIMFDGRVRVVDDYPGEEGLVIVAGAGREQIEPRLGGMPIGIHVYNGIDSNDDDATPIILVSDGSVNLDQVGAVSIGNQVDYLSVFAGGIYLRGPIEGEGYTTRYLHATGAYPDRPGRLIDWLVARSALPNGTGATNAPLALVPGTWRDLTP